MHDLSDTGIYYSKWKEVSRGRGYRQQTGFGESAPYSEVIRSFLGAFTGVRPRPQSLPK